MRNGINIASISELVQEIRECPAEARYAYSVRLRYHGGNLVRGSVNAVQVGTTTAGRNFSFDIDIGAEPPDCQDRAGMYRPEDLFVAGLGGCVMLTSVMGFTTRKVSLGEVSIDVAARCGPEPRLAYTIGALTDGSAAQSNEIIELVTSYSPNHRTIVDPGSIELSVIKLDDTRSGHAHVHDGAAATTRAARPPSVDLDACCQWDRSLQLVVDTRPPGGDGLVRQMLVDAPKQIGGIDLGPNPQEYLLLGLGAAILRECVMSEPECAASQVDMQLGGVVDLRGIMGIDPAVPVRMQDITCSVQIKGPGSAQACQHAFQRALERAPLARLISEPNNVAIRLREAQPC